MHPARRAQFAHPRIDERKAGASAAPRVELRVRAREGKAAHLLLQRFFFERFRVPRELQKEIALRERAQIEFDREPLFGKQKRIVQARARLAHDGTRGDRSERERGREA
jgi:hypothetical protein